MVSYDVPGLSKEPYACARRTRPTVFSNEDIIVILQCSE